MKYLLQPSRDFGCVTARDDAKEDDLVQRVLSADIVVADLDQTDAEPGKEMLLSVLINDKYFNDPRVWKWFFDAFQIWRKQENALEIIWQAFIKDFISQPEELARIKRKYTAKYAKTTFYKGVQEFYELKKNAVKTYITRNKQEVAQAYRHAADFDLIIWEQFDKQKALEYILESYRNTKNFIIRGDSAKEAELVAHLKDLKKYGKINDVVGICVAKNPETIDYSVWDIGVSRKNQKGLNKILQW